MGFNYFDVIAQSTERYRKSLSYIVSILIFSSFIFYIVKTDDINLHDYNFEVGYVDEIQKDRIKIKSKALYNPENYVFSEVISIKIENEYYYVNNEYKSKWDYIISNISNGDNIKIYYKISEGYRFLITIQNKELMVLSIDDLKNKQLIVIFTLFSVILIFLIILIIIIYKRMVYLKKK